MKDCWAAVERLRVSYKSLMDFKEGWIASSIVFRDWEFEDGYRLWTMLGLESQWCEMLVELQLRCTDGVLYVAVRFEDDADIVEKVSSVLTIVFRWRGWTDSRWLSAGDSTRTLLASIILGIESLVSYALHHGHSPKKLTNVVKQFVVQAALISFVADSALALLLTDDRLPVMWSALKLEIQCELEFIMDIPASIWALLGQVADTRSLALRSQVVHGSQVSACSLLKMYAKMEELPWRLCASDDVEEGVDALVRGDEPSEPVAWSIWQLAKIGFDVGELCQGVRLLRGLPWSQVSTEQGHSAAAVVMKKHRLYGSLMLQSKSMLLQMAILCRPCPQQKKLDRLRSALNRLDRSLPQRANGRHLFVSELISVATELTTGGVSAEVNIGKRLLMKHGEHWRAKTPAQQAVFHRKAREQVVEKQKQLQEKRDVLMASIRAQRQTLDQLACAQGPLRVGGCRPSDAEISKFDEAWFGPSFGGRFFEGAAGSASRGTGAAVCSTQGGIDAVLWHRPRRSVGA